EAFANVVDVCLAERARFLVLAGDVFDTGHREARSGLFFVAQLARLREAGCRVLLLRGNHDHDLTGRLDYPDHVFEFATPGAAYPPGAVKELEAPGYGYWALGHVHGRALRAEDPPVAYPGNTQGRSVRETGAKGCLVVEYDGARVVGAPRFVATDVMRYAIVEAPLARDDDRDELLSAVRERLVAAVADADGRLVAAR